MLNSVFYGNLSSLNYRKPRQKDGTKHSQGRMRVSNRSIAQMIAVGEVKRKNDYPKLSIVERKKCFFQNSLVFFVAAVPCCLSLHAGLPLHVPKRFPLAIENVVRCSYWVRRYHHRKVFLGSTVYNGITLIMWKFLSGLFPFPNSIRRTSNCDISISSSLHLCTTSI